MALLAGLESSPQARERVRVMLLTLAGDFTVAEGMARLGLSRTRFGVLRERMLMAAVTALEQGALGRPPGPREDAEALALSARIRELEHEVRVLRTQVALAQGPCGEAVLSRILGGVNERSV